MLLNREQYHLAYKWILIFIAVSLPLSRFTLSLGIISLAGAWILHWKWKEKLALFKKKKELWVFLSIYLIHFIGMIYSENQSYGWHDIQKKIPLLILPLVIGTSTPLKHGELKLLLHYFIGAIFVGSLVSWAALLGFGNHEITDTRDISIFISHIRFALMVNIAFFAGIYLFLDSIDKKINWIANLYLFMLLWLGTFVFVLRSFTGILIFLAGLYMLIFLALRYKKIARGKILLKTALYIMPLFILAYTGWAIYKFYNVEPVHPYEIDKLTARGNAYCHDFSSAELENATHVWLYVNEKETRETWNKISDYKYDSLDGKGQKIKYTLIRYLTSRGLRKDAVGVNQLSEKDIKNIELGYANYIHAKKFSVYARLYTIIWEIDRFIKGYNPGGHSVTQRILYLKSALEIIEEHFWIGTGTGDVQNAFENVYDTFDFKLGERWQRRAHNQYVTFLLTFGIFLWTWILFALVYPPLKNNKFSEYMFFFFFLISFASMLNEDTLETHVGASMFAFFYSLLIWGSSSKKIKKLFEHE